LRPGGGENPDAKIDRAVALAPNGNVVIAGAGTAPGTTLARFDDVRPQILLSVIKDSASKGHPAQVMIGRDDAYDFPTRVFFQTAGTARPGADFIGPFVIQPPQATGAQTRALVVGGGHSGEVAPKIGEIDIPAGKQSVTVPVTVLNTPDKTKTLTININDDDDYDVTPNSENTVFILGTNAAPIRISPHAATARAFSERLIEELAL
jgi:hypothetical protein